MLLVTATLNPLTCLEHGSCFSVSCFSSVICIFSVPWREKTGETKHAMLAYRVPSLVTCRGQVWRRVGTQGVSRIPIQAVEKWEEWREESTWGERKARVHRCWMGLLAALGPRGQNTEVGIQDGNGEREGKSVAG